MYWLPFLVCHGGSQASKFCHDNLDDNEQVSASKTLKKITKIVSEKTLQASSSDNMPSKCLLVC